MTPSPPPKEKHTVNLCLRLTPGELLTLTQMAEIDGLTESAMVRALIRRAARSEYSGIFPASLRPNLENPLAAQLQG